VLSKVTQILCFYEGNSMNDNYNLSNVDFNNNRLISNILYYFHFRGINISYLIDFNSYSILQLSNIDRNLIDFNLSNRQVLINSNFILDYDCILYSEYEFIKLNFDEYLKFVNNEYDSLDDIELVQVLRENFFYEFLKFGDFYCLFDSSNFTLFLKECESLFNYVLTTCNYENKQFKLYGSDMYDLIEFTNPDQFNIEINVINYFINELRLLINK
jgi:hypothetical protein